MSYKDENSTVLRASSVASKGCVLPKWSDATVNGTLWDTVQCFP